MAEQARRRRRVRPADDPELPAVADEGAGTAVTAATEDPWVALAAEPEPLPAERGLRGLVGSGSSQVSPAAAMRARDAARPRPEDIDRAEAELTIVRRRWSPRD